MYLTQIDNQERESEATRHLLKNVFFRRSLLEALEMRVLTWVVIEAQKPHLIPGLVGDVDILAGNLEFTNPEDYLHVRREAQIKGISGELACKVVTEAGGLRWPPVSSRLVGVEVKCGYFDPESGPKSTKSSTQNLARLRGQLERLLEMGLDTVALVDVIGNDPIEEQGAFIKAAGRAQDSAVAFQNIIQDRLPDDTPVAQFMWSVGAVGGGDEGNKGAGRLYQLRRGLLNPLLTAGNMGALSNRRLLTEKVTELLATVPNPPYCPVVFIDCRACGRLHYLEDSSCLRKAKLRRQLDSKELP